MDNIEFTSVMYNKFYYNEFINKQAHNLGSTT